MKKSNFKSNKNDILLIGTTFFIIFFSGPILTWFITKDKLTFLFIDESNINTWIAYYGAIIGGALTLFGVWWTIESGKEEKKHELSQQYKPILDLKFKLTMKHNKHYLFTEEYTEASIEEPDDPTTACFSIPITIKNVGRGEMYNIRYGFKTTNQNLFITEKTICGFLNPKEEIEDSINIRINHINNEVSQIDKEEISIFIIFEDLMNKTIYNGIYFEITYLKELDDNISLGCTPSVLSREIDKESY